MIDFFLFYYYFFFFSFCVGGKLTSRVFEDLVLGAVLFSAVIMGMVKPVSSQMRKFAGVTVLQGRKEERRG